MARKIIDITVPLRTGLACWPGDPEISIEPVARISRGDGANVSKYCFSSHASTHVDPPHHFIDSGYKLESIPLDSLIGPCIVVEFPDVSVITAEHFDSADIPEGTERIILKTRNSQVWKEDREVFHTDYAYITEDAADWLLAHGIKLLGNDYLSVAEFKQGGPVHRKLLGANVVLLEGVDLSLVEPGSYTLICLPLLVEGGDGAPARTVLIKD
jgi:arylformamidase